MFISTLQQTLIFLPLALGVYLSYEILKITDLTVEGTFVLGAAIFARLLTLGASQAEAIICALIGGAIIGVGVTLMQRIAKIDALISGILATFMLYSVNFGIMNQPNISLLNNHIFLQHLQNFNPHGFTLFLIGFSIILCICMTLFLHTKTGLYLRSFGHNPHLLTKLGKRPALFLCLGLSLSNMMSALCGVMTAQLDGYADIHMGLGMALTAIGAVVIGKKIIESLFRVKKFNAIIGLLSSFVGAFIYFFVLNGFLDLGINPIYLKLFLGLLLVVFLSSAHYTGKRGGGYESTTGF